MYSHDNDSGSFFIAILKKVSQIPFGNPKFSYYEKLPLNNINNNCSEGNKEIREEIENGKSIEDDLIEFCQQIGIKDAKIDLAIEKKKEMNIQKQIEYSKNNENCDGEGYENMNLFVYNRFTSILELLNEKNFIIDDETKTEVNGYISNLLSNYGINNDTIRSKLYCHKGSYKRIFLFSDRLFEFLKCLAEDNFYIMIAGLVVFIESRHRLTFEACRYRINYMGGLLLEECLNENRILNLDKLASETSSRNETIEFIEMLFENLHIQIAESKEFIAITNYLKSKAQGSYLLRCNQFVVPVHLGESRIKLMIPENVLLVLKNHIKNYIKD